MNFNLPCINFLKWVEIKHAATNERLCCSVNLVRYITHKTNTFSDISTADSFQ